MATDLLTTNKVSPKVQIKITLGALEADAVLRILWAGISRAEEGLGKYKYEKENPPHHKECEKRI